MKITRQNRNLKLALATCLAALVGNIGSATGQDSMHRLLEQANLNQPPVAEEEEVSEAQAAWYQKFQKQPKTKPPQPIKLGPTCSESACLIPSTIESADRIRRASLTQQGINFTDPTGFGVRQEVQAFSNNNLVYPVPLGYNAKPFNSDPHVNRAGERGSKISTPGYNGWHPDAQRDEYVFDGNDRGERVRVDQSYNIYGLQTEDTIGHFDTIDGRRIVTPSNRVAIYAPRFGAVRKVDGIFKAKLNLPVGSLEEKTPIAMQGGTHEATSAKQHLALNRFEGAKRASGFVDQTRGVTAGAVTHLFGTRNSFNAYENLDLIRFGKFSSSESARLNLGMQSALAWEDNLGLQVVAKKVSPIIVRDIATIQQLVSVESEDGTAILRVTKVASKIAARAGEEVEFTIRFDNLSGKKIGNVTLIDNLTRRLEYVPDSAECSHKADFITEDNDGGSLMLRWEIVDPVDAHKGGIIRFKCRVR